MPVRGAVRQIMTLLVVGKLSGTGCLLIHKSSPSATDWKSEHQYYGTDGVSISEALVEVVTLHYRSERIGQQ